MQLKCLLFFKELSFTFILTPILGQVLLIQRLRAVGEGRLHSYGTEIGLTRLALVILCKDKTAE